MPPLMGNPCATVKKACKVIKTRYLGYLSSAINVLTCTPAPPVCTKAYAAAATTRP
jgi:hypothetical protein